MYTKAANREPGKFEGCESQWLGKVLFFTMPDEEVGDASYSIWYSLIVGRKYSFIVTVDNLGFVTYEVYDSAAEAREVWGDITDEQIEYENRY